MFPLKNHYLTNSTLKNIYWQMLELNGPVEK